MPHALPTSLRLLSGLALAGMLTLSACGGGSGGSSGGSLPITPTPTPTPATGGTTSSTSVLCTTAGAAQSISRSSMADGVPKRVMLPSGAGAHVPGLIEVTYERASFSRVQARPAGLERTLDFPATNRVVQILRVDPSQEEATVNRLRSSPLVKSVSFGAYRYLQSTTASSAFTNDPFFQGFAPGNVPPFYQTAATGGQWDDHVMCAANAWAYGDTNTTGKTYAGALGGTAPIAIIDTGADLTHPELAGRVTYAEADLNGVVTAGLAGMHDNDGHGTDVAGIAAAAGNNALGFAGIAYAAPLMIFKVFPDPPSGGCPTNSTSSQCTALGSDIGLAINHAVAHGAKVINLSLGDTSADPAEENAVAAAIAAGVVVVAASGNGNAQFVGQPFLDYPAADPGVIAVGASALDDTNPAAIGEKVASYSNYSGANSASWGVVAPGGDPCAGSVSSSCNDQDDLHWIENIYTSTATDGSSTGACRPDPNSTSANDCRIFIAGTSQATPHVAGAASLLLSVGASANQIKSLLCSTAVPIPGGKAGCGRVNVYKAMAAAVGDPSP